MRNDTHNRRMGSMRRAECVFDIYVCEPSQCLGEPSFVLLFFSVKAQIFEHKYGAIRKLYALRLYGGADTVRGERHRNILKELLQPIRCGSETERRINFSFGAAQVRSQQYFCTVVECIANGRQCFANARVIRDCSVFIERNVEIDADEYAFPGE